MAVAGTLELQILTGLARLESDMKSATSTVDKAMKDINDSIQFAKKAMVALGAVMTVDAFIGLVKGVADANAGLKDLATQTGASEAALREFGKVGAYTETSAKDVADVMSKLAKNMASATEDGKGASAALRSLGISVSDFQKLRPEDQMLAVANAMNKYEDGAGKSAAAQALFGKEGAKLLPFLKDLADESDNVTKALTEQEIQYRKTVAQAGDQFSDNLLAIQKQMTGTKNVIIEGMLPALSLTSQAFLDVITGTNGVKKSASELAKDGSIATWTTGLVKGFSYVIDAAQIVVRYVDGLGKSIGGWAAAIMGFLTNDTVYGGIQAFKAALQGVEDDLAKTYSTDTLGKQLRDRMDELGQMPAAVDKTVKPTLDYANAVQKGEKAHKDRAKAIADEEKEMQKQADMYAKLKSGIDEKTLAMQSELDTGEKMSEADKILNKLQSDMIAGVITLTNVQMQEVYAKLDLMKQTEELTEARKRENKEIEQNTKENADMLEKLQQATAATEKDIAAAKEANLTYGMTTQELQALSIARMYDTAKTLDQKAAFFEQKMLNQDMADQYRKQAENIRTLAGLKEQGIHVKAARDAQSAWEQTTKSIGDGLVNALTRAVMDGKDIWLTFRNYMVTTILDGVLKNAIASVVSGAMQSMGFSAAGSAAPGLFGAIGAGTAGAGAAPAGAAGAGAGLASSGAAFNSALASSGAGGAAAGLGGASWASLGIAGGALLAYNAIIGGDSGWETVQRGTDNVSFGNINYGVSRNRNTGDAVIFSLDNVAFQAPTLDSLKMAIEMAGSETYWKAIQDQSTGGFAYGGDHSGGLRIVGENGPEIEATGAARIFNASETASMLRSGGASNTEVIAELKLLRTAFEQNIVSTNKINNNLEKVIVPADVSGELAITTRTVT